MANWGQPDFDPDEAIDYNALWAKIKAEGGMTEWPNKIMAGASPDLVQQHCVRDPVWQKTRLRMKGKPTHVKLAILHDWWFNAPRHGGYDPAVVEIQVANYLGALRRGGQLNSHNQIRKYI